MFPAGLAGAVTSLGVGFIAGPYSSRRNELHPQGCLWHDLTQCTGKYTAQKELFHVSLVLLFLLSSVKIQSCCKGAAGGNKECTEKSLQDLVDLLPRKGSAFPSQHNHPTSCSTGPPVAVPTPPPGRIEVLGFYLTHYRRFYIQNIFLDAELEYLTWDTSIMLYKHGVQPYAHGVQWGWDLDQHRSQCGAGCGNTFHTLQLQCTFSVAF